jgi:uncharacterized protein YecT (DUF1311 family)
MIRTLLAGLALAFVAASPVLAAADVSSLETRYTPGYNRCMNSSDGASTMGMIGCISDETTKQDAKLNAAYAKAMADLTPGQKVKLKAAQRAWIAFRDADCASFEDQDWGSLSRINANMCVLHRTVERTIELEDYPPET